ncbi:hypothetical protein F5X96DRAFT_694927 [Biscogniauxia mediterranea]|nr:hypothetical protein F5X96DRAFT_694927 [Biscogniauxia mediterranea]
MDNKGIAYAHSAEEVTQQPKGPDNHDELSLSELTTVTPSPNNNHHPSDETASSSSASSIPTEPETNNNNNNSEASPKKPVARMPAKPKKTLRFAESVTGDDSAATNAPKTPIITRSYKSMTTSPSPPTAAAAAARPSPTTTTATTTPTGRKRGRPPTDQSTTPRKRGRPRKNPVPVPAPVSVSVPTKQAPSSSSPPSRSTQTAEDNNTLLLMTSLVREAFVVHALAQQDDDEDGVRIPRDLALRIHALLAPGLPAPRADVRVGGDLAGRIRGLFGGDDGTSYLCARLRRLPTHECRHPGLGVDACSGLFAVEGAPVRRTELPTRAVGAAAAIAAAGGGWVRIFRQLPEATFRASSSFCVYGVPFRGSR